MSKRTPFLTLSATLSAAVGLLAVPGLADTINLTSGKTIDDVEIKEEKLDFVTYKEGRENKQVRSEEVLSIDFASKPPLVDRAEAALDEENYEAGAQDLEDFIAGALSKPPRRHPWSPPYAMYRLIEVYETVGEVELLVKAADRLLENAGESRYAPLAFLKKADALYDSGKASDAMEVKTAFDELLSQKNLGGRWPVESDLRGVLFDTKLSAKKREAALKEVSGKAGVAYPTVRNRAEVALGEALILGAGSEKDEGKKKEKWESAEKVFRDVTEDPKADDRTLAAAWSGLGDCLYQRGASMAQSDTKRDKVLREALMAYLRVVVVYKLQLGYVPKAMFWAGRTFDLLGDDESRDRAQEMYSKVIRSFRGTRWADEARGFRKRK
ncbi:MAG: hypothetical protein GY711_34645 [bacterium]|nr:hypothetical protein [bacterium]